MSLPASLLLLYVCLAYHKSTHHSSSSLVPVTSSLPALLLLFVMQAAEERLYLQTAAIVQPNFVKKWDDNGTCFKPHDCAIWTPIAPAGFYIVGDVMETAQNTNPTVMCIGVKDPNPDRSPPLLAAPVSYIKVWDTVGSDSRYGELSIWQPVPPQVSRNPTH
jgi:hypothetical protein